MSYNDTINYLYRLQKYGIKLGLDNISKLLSYFDNPQTGFSSIHVAGTNGKGSTAAMTASILEAAGLKVGLFTSPHLVSFTERIRVNNEEITEQEVVELTDEIRTRIQKSEHRTQNIPPTHPSPLRGEGKGEGGNPGSGIQAPGSNSKTQNSKLNPTFFEFITAMGFLYFKRKNVDWAVIETGMGGRLDATNVITPEVSVITSIGYDHKEFLGDTISAIAGEKAGIIKEGVPVVTALQEPEVMDIIKKKADEKSSPLFIYGKDFNGVLKLSDINGITFDYTADDYTIKNVFVPLAGKHQLFNACLAIKASVTALQNKMQDAGYKIQDTPLKPPLVRGEFKGGHASCITHRESCIKKGLANTRWHGRLELISDNPPILIDGAHNPSASAALADSLRNNFSKIYPKVILIMGIMADKDINGIMKPLLPIASEIILTAPAYERAASPEKLAECASAMGYQNIHIAQTVRDAIEMARNICGEDGNFRASGLIVITGSFYTIGEAKEALGEKGILSRLRE